MRVKALLMVTVFAVASGCASKSDLEAAQKLVAELRDHVQTLQQENAQLKAELSKKPKLPVTLALRKAVMGPGYVAMFNTTIKSPVTVLATLKSAALGTTKQFELHIDPSGATQLGPLEGATIEAGDIITLENANYQSISFTVTP